MTLRCFLIKRSKNANFFLAPNTKLEIRLNK